MTGGPITYEAERPEVIDERVESEVRKPVKIYTRGGDEGETALFGGNRVAKNDPRVRAYGAVDELNAALGLALALDREGSFDHDGLAAVQEDLFAVGARLAAADPARARERGSIPELPSARVADLETWIDRLDEELPALDAFILPGGSPAGAQLHVARTVCRRAEREIVGLVETQPDLAEVVLPYVNRLSDLLFELARAVNLREGRPEREWRTRPPRSGGGVRGDSRREDAGRGNARREEP